MQWYKKVFRLSASDVLRRFPFPAVFALIGAGLTTYMTVGTKPAYPALFTVGAFAALLAVLITTGCALWAQREHYTGARYYGAQALGILPALLYAWVAMPSNLNTEYSPRSITLFLLMLLASFAFVMVAPYLTQKNEMGFWQFNKWLLLRVFLAAFSGVILFGALSLALFSINVLFGVDIDEEYYFVLWQWVVIVYGSLFVLFGVYPKLETYDKDTTTPDIIRKFAIYILTPILSVYFVIIYAYLAKILFIQRQLPEGGLAMPVILYASVVIIAMLLTYPWYMKEGTHISAKILRWAFYSLIPALPMFFVALGVRIGEFGITVPRYLGVVTGVWFVYIVIYALVCKCMYLKRYFLVAIMLLLIAGYGPWSAFSVSQTSQSKRFISLVEEKGFVNQHGYFSEEVFAEAPFTDVFEVQDMARHIHNNYSLDDIRPIFNDPTASLIATDEEILEKLDIGFFEPVERPGKDAKQIIFFSQNGIGIRDVERYEVLIDIEHNEAGLILYDQNGTRIELSSDAKLNITHEGKSVSKDVREILDEHAYATERATGLQRDPIVIELEGEDIHALVLLQSIFGYLTQEKLEITGVTGVVLLDTE